MRFLLAQPPFQRYPELLEEWDRCEIIPLPLNPLRHQAEMLNSIQMFTVNLYAAVSASAAAADSSSSSGGGGGGGASNTSGDVFHAAAATSASSISAESSLPRLPSSRWSWYVTLERGVHKDGE